MPIGGWVLREACRQAREWLDEGFEPIAVNLSGKQCRHDGFLARGAAACRATRLAGAAPTVRTDREHDDRPRGDRRVLGDGAAGISLAIDDFGTGYSAFAYLQSLPVDTLKIDRSFLAQIGPGTTDGAIVRAIVAMARALGITVVAEGVEYDAQWRFLREIGCDRAQGLFAGRAGPRRAVGPHRTRRAYRPCRAGERALLVDGKLGTAAEPLPHPMPQPYAGLTAASLQA